MTYRQSTSAVACVAFFALSATLSFADFAETFDSDPIGGSATVEGSNNSRDTFLDPAQPFVHSGGGTMLHNLCSNWRITGGSVDTTSFEADGSRLSFALGKVYTEADSFSFGATLRILSGGIYSAGWAQVAFGLTNSTTTGFDRTSSPSTAGNTYDGIEWNFFPADDPSGYPTAQGLVFGTQSGASSAFGRMAVTFGSLLPQEPGREYGLPLDTWMDVSVRYDAATRTASVSIVETATSTPLANATMVPDAILPAKWLDDAPARFAVNQLSIMNYQDGWGFGPMPSLLATVEYDSVWFAEEESGQPVAEPEIVAGLGLGLLALGGARKRRN